MDSLHLDPFSAAGSKTKQIQDAKKMQQVVIERVNRIGGTIPPYDFIELIGKGAFGRVYKCKRSSTREVVAVKIIDVDDMDYSVNNNQKDEAISDFIKEVNTLKHLKDSKAQNINYIQDAFDLHSQLWIVSDYCPGGSVHTLMKATQGQGLDERYIIPIARELAIALKFVHEAGVIHRDVKCGNILISEDGRIQLCDFGVSAIIESDVSKRSTIIGTPFWMAPEMHEAMNSDSGNMEQGYGMEIDCWAYGCTVFEMATGVPPNHNFHPRYLNQVLKSTPKLDDEQYSQELCEFVAFCLQASPEDRPKAVQIVEHPYVDQTYQKYPTSLVRQMIDAYLRWERKGGQRMSLFAKDGAAAPELSGELPDQEEWVFSTTDHFEQDFERRYSQIGVSAVDFGGADTGYLPAEVDLPSGPVKELTPLEKAKEEARAYRGERYMERLFDPQAEPYDYDTSLVEDDDPPLSDLPLRNMSSDRAANRETLIDLDTSGLAQPTFNFLDFSEVPTLKANREKSNSINSSEEDGEYYNSGGQDDRRATKDWKFPSLTVPAQDPPENQNRRTIDWTFDTAGQPTADLEPEPSFTFPLAQNGGTAQPGFRPNLTRVATEPIGQFSDFLHPPQLSLETGQGNVRDSTPMIDLDDYGDGLQPNFQQSLHPSFDMDMPSEIGQISSPVSLASSLTSFGPFDLEQDPIQREEDLKRFSHRRPHRAEGYPANPNNRLSRSVHLRGQSYGAFNHTTRVRGNSVDSTASSDAPGGDVGWDYSRHVGAHTEGQLRSNVQNPAAPASVHGVSPRYPVTSFDDIDTDGPGSSSDVNGSGYYDRSRPGSALNRFRRANTLDDDTDSSAFEELTVPRTRFRGETQSPVNGYDSEGRAYRQQSRTLRPGTRFPPTTVPDPAALAEGADHAIMEKELDKQFASMQAGLAFFDSILSQREEGLDQESESEMDQLDMPSEDEDNYDGFT